MAEQCGPTRGPAPRTPEDALHTAHDPREQAVNDCAAELAQAKRELPDNVLRRKQSDESLEPKNI